MPDAIVRMPARRRIAANVHIAVNWDLAGTTYGRISLGLDPITPVIRRLGGARRSGTG